MRPPLLNPLFESFVELSDDLLSLLTLGNVGQHVDGADQRTRWKAALVPNMTSIPTT